MTGVSLTDNGLALEGAGTIRKERLSRVGEVRKRKSAGAPAGGTLEKPGRTVRRWGISEMTGHDWPGGGGSMFPSRPGQARPGTLHGAEQPPNASVSALAFRPSPPPRPPSRSQTAALSPACRMRACVGAIAAGCRLPCWVATVSARVPCVHRQETEAPSANLVGRVRAQTASVALLPSCPCLCVLLPLPFRSLAPACSAPCPCPIPGPNAGTEPTARLIGPPRSDIARLPPTSTPTSTPSPFHRLSSPAPARHVVGAFARGLLSLLSLLSLCLFLD